MHQHERRARPGRRLTATLLLACGVSCTEGPNLTALDQSHPARVESPARENSDAAAAMTTPGHEHDAAAVADNDAGTSTVDPSDQPHRPSAQTADAGTSERVSDPDAGAGTATAADSDSSAASSTRREPVSLPSISAPQALGVLVGPEHVPQDLTLHGTDLGFPVASDDSLLLFFGDTTKQPTDLCSDQGNDDMLASIPLTFPGSVPELSVYRNTQDPQRWQPLTLMDGAASLTLDVGRVPIGGFRSDGQVYSWFNRLELVRCDPDDATQGCGGVASFRCVTDIGECAPNRSVVVPPLCDLSAGTGCMPEQRCEAASSGFCIDPSSSQFDGTTAGNIAAAVHRLDLGRQRVDEPSVFDRIATFETNKFQNIALAQIASWTGMREGNDYALGERALLLWGRPGFTGGDAREAQIYLMSLPLPLPSVDTEDAPDPRIWQPSYFAGLSTVDGQPRWSTDQADARALAMDGTTDGDPHEEVVLVNQTSIAYVGGQVRKWVMLYGGDISDLLVQDADAVRTGPSPGSILLRVADDPWGPFSPAVPHLEPGVPGQVGSSYGPGGILYHPRCQDTPTARCAPANGTVNLLECLQTAALVDQGRLYGAMILPTYMRENGGGGIDLFWNVSTWVPYSVVMFKTSLGPSAAVNTY